MMKTIIKINRKDMNNQLKEDRSFELTEKAIRSFAKDIAKILNNEEISEVHRDE